MTQSFGLVALTLLWAQGSVLAQTEYKTRGDVPWIGTTKTNLGTFKTEQAEACKLPGEELPAGGNVVWAWGFPLEGFQIAIGFDKQEFAVGDAVVASILVRNASTGPVTDAILFVERTEFLVTNGKREELARTDIFRAGATAEEVWKRDIVKGGNAVLEVGTQRKFKMMLSEIFDLSQPGTYWITAKRRFRAQNGRDMVELATAAAKIQVVGKPGTPAPSSVVTAMSGPLKGASPANSNTVGSNSPVRATVGNIASSEVQDGSDTSSVASGKAQPPTGNGRRSASQTPDLNEPSRRLISQVRLMSFILIAVAALGLLAGTLLKRRRPPR